MAGNEWIFDANQGNVQEKVVNASQKHPVLVVFWLPRQESSQPVLPTLESVVRSFQGKVALAKVNVEADPVMPQIFGVQSVPAFKLVHNGEIVDEFQDQPTEKALSKFLAPYVQSPEEKEMEEIRRLHESGDRERLEPLLKDFVSRHPEYSEAKVLWAELIMDQGEEQKQEASRLLSSIEMGDSYYDKAQSLLKKMSLQQQRLDDGVLQELEQAVADNPRDWNRRTELGEAYLAGEDYVKAMEAFVQILEDKNSEQRERAHSNLLHAFELLGPMHPEVIRYRRRLAGALF